MRASAKPIYLLFIMSVLAACSTIENTVPDTATAASLVWPSPPLEPRIRFLTSVTRGRDLGIKFSFWRRMRNFVRGDEEMLFVRPADVAARGDALYVADVGAPALWILDPRRQRTRRVSAAGAQQLVSPVAVTLDPGDRVFLADSYHRKVFVYDSNGELQSVVSDQRFERPAGLAYDSGADLLYVADSAAHRVWVIDGAGNLERAIGRRGVAPGEFNYPTHVAIGRDNTVYVTDALGFRIQTFTRDGRFVSSFGRHGDGSGDFAAPKGVAGDSDGHVYVVDALFDTVQIFDSGGRLLLNFGSHGAHAGQFWLPGGIFIDADDRIYVADGYNQRIQVFQYLKGNRFD